MIGAFAAEYWKSSGRYISDAPFNKDSEMNAELEWRSGSLHILTPLPHTVQPLEHSFRLFYPYLMQTAASFRPYLQVALFT